MLKKYNELKRQVKQVNQDLNQYEINYITSYIYNEEKSKKTIACENEVKQEVLTQEVEEVQSPLEHDLGSKQIWGISKDTIIAYCKYLHFYNNGDTTKTLINIRWLQANKGFLPTVRINVKNVDGAWKIKGYSLKSETSKNFWNNIEF